MPVELTDVSIDPNDKRYQTMLETLQGNIIKGHGRDFTIHIFLKFTSELKDVKSWIRQFSEHHVTPAKRQLQETERFKAERISGGLFGNFFLTSKGYENILQLSQGQLAQLFQEEGDTTVSFLKGMEASQQELNDAAPETWEEAYRGKTIHAMILLADDDENFLLQEAAKVESEVKAVAEVLAVEQGRVLRNTSNNAIEHFGYADGVSQPLFLKPDIEHEKSQVGIDNWEPSAPLKLVLVKDPNVKEEDSFGSYFVFRKLEQNVRGFKEKERELATALGLMGKDEERAGALVVGRFEDGTPVVLHPAAQETAIPLNNFRYDQDDPNGTKCPFHAHIRKTNPRGDISKKFGLDEEQSERSRRIVRRGITYGQREVGSENDVPLEQLPTGGVGLLFMCFQNSIPKQFGFMQKSWANDPNFLNDGTGFDPVIGQKGIEGTSQGQLWPEKWGNPETKPFDFANFVTLKGGEFFFAPSMSFLKGL